MDMSRTQHAHSRNTLAFVTRKGRRMASVKTHTWFIELSHIIYIIQNYTRFKSSLNLCFFYIHILICFCYHHTKHFHGTFISSTTLATTRTILNGSEKQYRFLELMCAPMLAKRRRDVYGKTTFRRISCAHLNIAMHTKYIRVYMI